MTYRTSPHIEESSTLNIFKIYHISPSGMVGCFSSGLILGAVYGLIPAFTENIGFSVEDTALTMFMIIFGGTLLQYPVGHLSDLFDRRHVLLFLTFTTALLSIALLFAAQAHAWIFLALCFFFGGVSFVLYPLSISHACDYMDPQDVVAATGGLVLAYGLGASIGPMLAPLFINLIGEQGLFIYFSTSSAFLAIFIIWRMSQRKSMPYEAQQQFIAVPRTTPIANELDPRAQLTEAFQKDHLQQGDKETS